MLKLFYYLVSVGIWLQDRIQSTSGRADDALATTAIALPYTDILFDATRAAQTALAAGRIVRHPN
jgi:hypothetical protein